MFDVLTNLGLLASILGSITLSLLFAVPLSGALVRVRANYNPRGLQLDDEGNVEPHTGPVVTSFFGMLARVKRIEGWAGLYKGLMPTLVETSFLTMVAVLVLSANPNFSRKAVPDGIFKMLLYSAVAILISLPSVVLTYRSVTTPYRLPFFNPLYALRVLLTPYERRRPWLIFLTPGLFLSQFVHSAYALLFLRTLHKLLLPPSENAPSPLFDANPVNIGIYLTIAGLSTIILCPLEVITTKLAIQRNHAAPEYNSVEQEVESDAVDAEEYVEYSGSDEDVIGLRHEKDPYLGMMDCARRVAQEEGWTALYRAWWFTFFVSLATVFN